MQYIFHTSRNPMNTFIIDCIISLYIDLLWKTNSMIHLFLVISIIWKCITRKKIQLHFRYEYINDYLTSLSGMSTLAYTLHHAITKVHSCKMRLTRKLGSWCIVVLKTTLMPFNKLTKSKSLRYIDFTLDGMKEYNGYEH